MAALRVYPEKPTQEHKDALRGYHTLARLRTHPCPAATLVVGMSGLATDHWWQLFLFSAVGSCTAETATVPIDVVKARRHRPCPRLAVAMLAVLRYITGSAASLRFAVTTPTTSCPVPVDVDR